MVLFANDILENQWVFKEGKQRGLVYKHDFLSSTHKHTTKTRQALFRGNISGRNNYSILTAAGVVAQQGKGKCEAMRGTHWQ